MRYGRAIIPVGSMKSSLLADLECLRTKYDEVFINDTEFVTNLLPTVMTKNQDLIEYLKFRSSSDKLAVSCIKKYLENRGSTSLQYNIKKDAHVI